MRPAYLLAWVLLAAFPARAQDPYIRTTTGVFALTNARIETVTNGTIERGTVVLRNGRIESVGADASVPADAEVIDCTGLTVYPGMIDGGTGLGLQEIGSLPETIDRDEVGEVSPQMQALTAVNPHSVLIPVTRVAGVTTVLTTPTGGLLPGTAALVHLHGYTPEQMDGGFRGVVLSFPSSARRGGFDRRTDEEVEKEFEEAMERLDETWDQAVLFARIDSAAVAGGHPREPVYQPEMTALLPAIRRQAPVLVEVNAAQDIEKALEWIERRNVRAILTGAAEGWRVADKIAAAGVPVIVGPIQRLPTRASDRYDVMYRNPGLLREAGVPVALRTSEVENVRNLPFHAGFAAAWGMGREAALEAVTIVPARIFGVDREVGSIEAGKRGTLFVADGDPFEPRTQVRHLFIDGYRIPIQSRQIALYEEFLHRSPGLTK
ncbi:MAG TPA: amidohydrolase family protein [Rubricoccaceae bacterium]|nr:amidohydrolase family protein [Rubricoccaceae bacterium]